MASIKIKTPKNISMHKIKLILALFLYIILTDRVFTLTSKSVILLLIFRRIIAMIKNYKIFLLFLFSLPMTIFAGAEVLLILMDKI